MFNIKAVVDVVDIALLEEAPDVFTMEEDEVEYKVGAVEGKEDEVQDEEEEDEREEADEEW